jgi:hypothetical protein
MRTRRVQNIDLRYYRDKYVAGLFVLSMIVAVVVFSGWPPSHIEFIRGVKLLAVAAICIAFSPYRLVAVAALFAFAALRFFLTAILSGWWPGFIVALGCVSVAMLFALGRLWLKGDYSLPYKIRPYSTIESVIDVFAFLVMLGLIRLVIA